MKRLVILAAMLAALCSVANAQPVSQDSRGPGSDSALFVPVGGTDASGINRKLRLSTTNGLSIYDEAPDRENWSLINGGAIITRDTTVAATILADSSAILDVHSYRHMILCFKLNGVEHTAAGFANPPDVRLAVQIRTHLNGLSDSSSTFAYYPFGVGLGGVTTAAVAGGDTLVTGHVFTGSATAQWSGEFAVNVMGSRAAGSTLTWQFPNGIAIPLDSILGRDFWAPYISIRVRIISTSTWKWFGNIYLMGSSL